MTSKIRSGARVNRLLWGWSLNRPAAHFSAVTAAEMAELAPMLGTIERSLKSAFAYDIINYLMLMMVDHHVHFHVIPRYGNSRQFAGLSWFNRGWPALPVLADQQHADQADVLASVREALASR